MIAEPPVSHSQTDSRQAFQLLKTRLHRQMVDALVVGTEVVTGGGVLGKVMEVGEQFVTVEIAAGVQVKVQRHSIGAVLPKDTLKHV